MKNKVHYVPDDAWKNPLCGVYKNRLVKTTVLADATCKGCLRYAELTKNVRPKQEVVTGTWIN